MRSIQTFLEKLPFQSILERLIKPPVMFLLIIVLLLLSGIIFRQYKDTQSQLSKLREESSQSTLLETEKLIEKVGKLVELPTDEDPTVATITDKEKLKDQVFFQRAEKGDKVLIYAEAKQAFLYRPSTNKVINVAPINIGSSSANPSAQQRSISPTPTIGFRQSPNLIPTGVSAQ